MRLSPRLLAILTMLVAAIAVAAAPALARSRGHHKGSRGGKVKIAQRLVPSEVSDPSIFGVPPGAADWKLRKGVVKIKRNGRIIVKVRGLVFADTGTTTIETGTAGPFTLTDVSASLFCNGESVGTTDTAPLSASGDAKIRGQLTLPAKCVAPVVMVHPATNTEVYIAISGL